MKSALSLFKEFNSKKNQRGFTLIEILVVIGILAVLLAITLIAINPARQFAQANNTKRSSDVNAILNAVGQYSADNKGNLSALGITGTPTEISDAGIDICAILVTKYIAALPVDPLTNNGNEIDASECAAPYTTGYVISQSVNDSRITVTAPSTELGIADISVTR